MSRLHMGLWEVAQKGLPTSLLDGAGFDGQDTPGPGGGQARVDLTGVGRAATESPGGGPALCPAGTWPIPGLSCCPSADGAADPTPRGWEWRAAQTIESRQRFAERAPA